MDAADLQISALRSMSGTKAIAAILGVSAAVFLFLVWLIYFKPAAGYSSEVIGALPAVNATLNGLSSIFLIIAFVAVKQRRYSSHIRWIFAAVVSSTLFLISYVVYHNAHGSTPFTGQGMVRPIYYFVLISHIVLSAIVLPLILTTLYLSLAGRLAVHRRVARYTFPIWLYVSITGVLIFVMLKVFSS